MQNTKENLENLGSIQLQILFQHISLGKDHLKNVLTTRQLNDLYKWVELKEDQKSKIEATKIEQLGNMSLMINTMLTSTFGAWMGLSGCIGCGLGSYKALMLISIFAFFLSGFIGYISSNKTKEAAIQSIEKQRLLNFQSYVLKTLIDRLNKKNEEQVNYLNSAVFILKRLKSEIDKPDFSFTTLNETVNWFDQFESTLMNSIKEIEGHSAQEFYQKKIIQGCYTIRKTLNKHMNFLENLSSRAKKNDRRSKIKPTLSFLKILTDPNYASTKVNINKNHKWSLPDFKDLVLGLIPTIWGGFASMFVFVGGIPNIARELGFTDLSTFLTDPSSRFVEIMLALFVTIYFGFSYLYSTKKNKQRELLIEHTSNEITKLESELLISRHKLTTLYTLKNSMQKIISIFNVIKITDLSTESTFNS